jgi:hypothetical protein
MGRPRKTRPLDLRVAWLSATLRSCIEKNHLGGKVRSSTLRRSLAAVLLGPSALTVDGRQQLAPGSEAKLTLWMREHLAIAVGAAPSGDHLAALEREVVQALQPPFNLEHMAPSKLRRRLRELQSVVTCGIDDLWIAPDPALGQWRRILGDCGQAFDGYRYATAVRRSCPDIAQEVERRFEREGRFWAASPSCAAPCSGRSAQYTTPSSPLAG